MLLVQVLEAYPELSQASNMALLLKIVNIFQQLPIFAEICNLEVWLVLDLPIDSVILFDVVVKMS